MSNQISDIERFKRLLPRKKAGKEHEVTGIAHEAAVCLDGKQSSGIGLKIAAGASQLLSGASHSNGDICFHLIIDSNSSLLLAARTVHVLPQVSCPVTRTP